MCIHVCGGWGSLHGLLALTCLVSVHVPGGVPLHCPFDYDHSAAISAAAGTRPDYNIQKEPHLARGLAMSFKAKEGASPDLVTVVSQLRVPDLRYLTTKLGSGWTPDESKKALVQQVCELLREALDWVSMWE